MAKSNHEVQVVESTRLAEVARAAWDDTMDTLVDMLAWAVSPVHELSYWLTRIGL